MSFHPSSLSSLLAGAPDGSNYGLEWLLLLHLSRAFALLRLLSMRLDRYHGLMSTGASSDDIAASIYDINVTGALLQERLQTIRSLLLPPVPFNEPDPNHAPSPLTPPGSDAESGDPGSGYDSDVVDEDA